MHLGIAELWSLHLDDARDHLEEALRSPAASAGRISRPVASATAPIAVLSGEPPASGLQLSEEAVRIAEAHGWAADRIVDPAVAAGGGALAWLGHSTRPSSG